MISETCGDSGESEKGNGEKSRWAREYCYVLSPAGEIQNTFPNYFTGRQQDWSVFSPALITYRMRPAHEALTLLPQFCLCPCLRLSSTDYLREAHKPRVSQTRAWAGEAVSELETSDFQVNRVAPGERALGIISVFYSLFHFSSSNMCSLCWGSSGTCSGLTIH